MHDSLRPEVWRLIGVLLGVVLIGSLTGHWLAAAVVLQAAYIAWHLHQLYLLERWLHIGSLADRERLSGIWRHLADKASRAQRRSKKRKKRLSRVLQRFHNTLEAMPDAAVVIDRKSQVEWANSSARLLLGLVHRTPARPITELMPDEPFKTYFAAGDFKSPLEMQSPVDPHVELELRITPFSRGYLLLTGHDITEEKALLTMRKDFVANVSHELRTPLTVISGYLELLLEERLPEDVTGALEACNRQAFRMQNLVRDLLTLSRLETEESGLAPMEPAGVPTFLPNLVHDAAQLSGELRHRFTLLMDEDLDVCGSENDLSSAFGNLIFNAVAHTPPQTPVTVYWGREGEAAKLVVEDKGPGVNPSHLQRLTERFYRVDKGRSRETGGTGLGLSIVKHVMKHHEGRVEIESAPGQGCRFICIFPASRVIYQPAAQSETLGHSGNP